MSKAPSFIDKHVGARVRMRRILKGLSQEKLGDALQVTFQQVQKYEKGVNRIGASRLQLISEVLQTPLSYFFDGAPKSDEAAATGFAEEGSAYVVDFLSTVEGLQLNRAFANIRDPKLRKRIVDLVVAIAGGDKDAASAA